MNIRFLINNTNLSHLICEVCKMCVGMNLHVNDISHFHTFIKWIDSLEHAYACKTSWEIVKWQNLPSSKVPTHFVYRNSLLSSWSCRSRGQMARVLCSCAFIYIQWSFSTSHKIHLIFFLFLRLFVALKSDLMVWNSKFRHFWGLWLFQYAHRINWNKTK